MLYTAQEMARYVINKCIRDGHPVSNLQLQKILYFLQVGVIHAKRGLAFGDGIEAWQFGPVVPGVYFRYGCYGAMPITDLMEDVRVIPEDGLILNPIIEKRQTQRAWELVQESHKKGGPWDRNYGGPGTHNPIPLEDIELYG